MSTEPKVAASAPSALRFLVPSPGDATSRPTVCWLKREPGLVLDAWSLHLEPPSSDATYVENIKQWALFGEDPFRFLEPTGSSAASDLRRYGRYELLAKYLRAVCDTLPPAALEHPWCLMPAVADSARRKAYSDALLTALPNAKILHEPEMVLEYFRLVRREVRLESGRHGIFLIVDAGASTTNFTIVVSNLDDTVTSGETARARPKSLDAKTGHAPKFAGAWIDGELTNLLGWSGALRGFAPSARSMLLAAVEAAKVQASSSGASALIGHALAPTREVVSEDLLRKAAQALWARLQPTYIGVVEQFLAGLQKGKLGAPLRARLAELGIDDASGVHRAIDAVFLAGGTSQLPGFRDAMLETIFPLNPTVAVHAVGGAYKVAAAVGALAHVLDQRYAPSRLHARPDTDAPDSLASVTFNATPTTDVVLAWRQGEEQEEKLTLIDRTDELLIEGGEREVVGLPNFEVDTQLRARLLPGAEVSRAGIGMRSLTVTSAPVTAKVVVSNRVREVRLQSPELRGTHGLVLDLNQRTNLAPEPTRAREPGVRLWSDGAPDVVIDLGMSKTVVVRADEGPFEVDDPALVSTDAPPAVETAEPAVPAPGAPVATLADAVEAGDTFVDAPEDDPPVGPPSPGETAPVQLRAASVRDGDVAPGPLAPEPAPARDSLQSPERFGAQLREASERLIAAGMATTAGDLAMLLLALAVRPFVLLAGPPGSGKSTLVRVAAKVLGLADARTFHEVTVQPHWRSYRNLPEEIRSPPTGRRGLTLCLFDEVNLTPAENYLMPLFKQQHDEDGSTSRLLLCGTLNIDDASRPPSPKIVDRSFFLSMDAPLDEVVRESPLGLVASRTIAALPEAPSSSQALRGRGAEVVRLIQSHVRTSNLRPDLLPSLRDIRDLERIVAIHEACDIETVLTQDNLDDQMIAGRLLTKVAGAADQVGTLVEALRQYFDGQPTLLRCRRAMAVAQAQLRLGFVSPWQ